MHKILKSKINSKELKIGVMGLGYVGLPLALEFVASGYFVYGFDKNVSKISSLIKCKSYVVDVSDEKLKSANTTKRFFITEKFEYLRNSDAIIICVPTPLRKSKDPDMSYILNATDEILNYFKRGQIIILESTTYPGTTREIILTAIEKKYPKYKVGKDFFVAFSPERVDPGNEKYNTRNTPKIIGGITNTCTEIASYLYSKVLEKVITVSNTETAEMVKLLENTFRSVNIGLINEISLMCERLKVNVWEVIEAAKSKPYGFMPFYPGPGIGGHCIPLDPYYLSWKMKTLNFYSRFIELAGEVNSKMPEFVITKIMEILNIHNKCLKKSRICVVGVAYKKNVSDYRESPAIDIIEMLIKKEATVEYYDPYVEYLKEGDLNMKSININNLNKYDMTVIITDHSCVDYQLVVDKSKLIYDTRNCLKNFTSGKIYFL